MSSKEISFLPKEFNFVSNINRGLLYHAIETDHCYVVTIDECVFEYGKREFRQFLSTDVFVVII